MNFSGLSMLHPMVFTFVRSTAKEFMFMHSFSIKNHNYDKVNNLDCVLHTVHLRGCLSCIGISMNDLDQSCIT